MRCVPVELEELLGLSGSILRAQATFVVLRVAGHQDREIKIDFRRALRRSRLSGPFQSLGLSDRHPLCVPYEEQVGRVAFHSGPKDAVGFLAALTEATRSKLGNWVALEEIMNPCFMVPGKLGPRSNGQLFYGPLSLVQDLLPILEDHGVGFRLFKLEQRTVHAWALTLDGMYVVSTEFQRARLCAE